MQLSELILNDDGSVYHLGLLPDDISDTVVLVGDPNRVAQVSKYFDSIKIQKQKREFITHSGTYHQKRITVISTGIGSDNIDIVMNELNILRKDAENPLTIYRLGTSGALDPETKTGTVVLSASAIGLDGLPYYYHGFEVETACDFMEKMNWNANLAKPYLVFPDMDLLTAWSKWHASSCTLTAQGFYGPQGRSLGENKAAFTSKELFDAGIGNIEMETAAIYALSKLFGFKALSLNVILANRQTGSFDAHPKEKVETMIVDFLKRLV